MFGISDYDALCAAVLLFLALPGPGALPLLTSTGKGGFRAGAAATVGPILGDQVLLWLALLAAHPSAFRRGQYGGAAYLGWKVNRRADRRTQWVAGIFLIGYGIRLGSH